MLFDPKWARPVVDAVGKVMLAAADLIEREGHCWGVMFDGSGYCVLGAIRWALQGSSYPGNDYDKIVQRLERAIELVPGNPVHSVAVWNDHHSKAEAIALLRGAALG